ncbi:MAG: hypothetical protein KGI41_00195 [Patescibacteria group bacterium]|nr:hypothetical protein [Patescibacteria group bacterium]MDE1965652.1 hypothetical protein [Patescibacteria group bacterium]
MRDRLRQLLEGDLYVAAEIWRVARAEYGPKHITAEASVRAYGRAEAALRAFHAGDGIAVLAYFREEYRTALRNIAFWESKPLHTDGRAMLIAVSRTRKAQLELFLPGAEHVS